MVTKGFPTVSQHALPSPWVFFEPVGPRPTSRFHDPFSQIVTPRSQNAASKSWRVHKLGVHFVTACCLAYGEAWGTAWNHPNPKILPDPAICSMEIKGNQGFLLVICGVFGAKVLGLTQTRPLLDNRHWPPETSRVQESPKDWKTSLHYRVPLSVCRVMQSPYQSETARYSSGLTPKDPGSLYHLNITNFVWFSSQPPTSQSPKSLKSWINTVP